MDRSDTLSETFHKKRAHKCVSEILDQLKDQTDELGFTLSPRSKLNRKQNAAANAIVEGGLIALGGGIVEYKTVDHSFPYVAPIVGVLWGISRYATSVHFDNYYIDEAVKNFQNKANDVAEKFEDNSFVQKTIDECSEFIKNGFVATDVMIETKKKQAKDYLGLD